MASAPTIDARSVGLSERPFDRFRRWLTRKPVVGVLMVAPLLAVIIGLVAYPFFHSLYLATLNKAETEFVGLDNFLFLFKRETFWMVVRQSIIFALLAVFFKALIGLIAAHAVNTIPSKGQRKWRGMMLVPWVIPPALSTLGWWWLFEPTYSAINWLLVQVGATAIPWLSDTFWARFSIILVNVWVGAPFFLIMYLAALKSIPEELYEAAAIDGAGPWQRFVHITLPMMRNIIAITVLFSTIVTFANFDIVRVLTQGGPRNTTHLFATYAFRVGIESGDIPLGATVSLFMFPVLAVLAFIILRNVRRRAMEVLMASVTADSAAPKQGSKAQSRRWALFAAYACLIVFVIFFLFPPYYMLLTSLKTNAEIAELSTNPWIISKGVTFTHYISLLRDTAFPTYFLNTAIVTLCVVSVTMVISILAAYALSRLRFWGAGVLATGVFLTYLVPDTLLFIPLFKIVGWLGLLNSYWSLVLVYPTLTVPFCTWILIGYFASIPKELDEAALIDGANHLQMLVKIFIPVALPGIIAAMIFAFTVSWASFIYPLAYIYSDDQMVLTVGTVTTLIKGDVFHWGGLMAGALLAAAPPVILYAFLMDYYIAGLTSGATKG